jgi:hypothetical protein
MCRIEVCAYGSLRPAAEAAANRLRDLPEDFEAPVGDILSRLNISKSEVQLIMRNHRPVTMNAMVRSGDRIALFPQEYPIFADWDDYRSIAR